MVGGYRVNSGNKAFCFKWKMETASLAQWNKAINCDPGDKPRWRGWGKCMSRHVLLSGMDIGRLDITQTFCLPEDRATITLHVKL